MCNYPFTHITYYINASIQLQNVKKSLKWYHGINSRMLKLKSIYLILMFLWKAWTEKFGTLCLSMNHFILILPLRINNILRKNLQDDILLF